MQSISKKFAYASLWCGASLLAGCGATTAGLPASSAWAPSTSRHVLPLNGGDLLYLSSYAESAVKAYDWPGLKQSQTLKGFTQEEGLCTDKKGNVFVANLAANNIVEYAHGGKKPIATLNDLTGYQPGSCAVDPVSGDLAVTNLAYYLSGSGMANVVIFRHATGHPQPYKIPTIYSYYMCGYDEHGNLIVDGFGYHAPGAFAILPHGAQHLQKLTLDPEPAGPGGIQWDGKYWAIGDTYSTIYRFDVTGSKGTKVGTTTLQESSTVFEFFIFGDRIIAPEHETGKVQIFPYPGGGAPVGTIRGLNLPFGATISRGN